MLKMLSKKILATLVAFSALISGVCWLISANTQVQSLSAKPEVAITLAKVSALMNQSAAVAAMVGGFCVALAIIAED
ncbi:hypothetical protein [Pseudomonas sp. NBRC 111122]|uniref:hypothetical protein n=1 Tax=Pseudomonas sp. NBRC 111122 TaxID=1661037 RepID=UPI0008636A40|nr:hypothetical protein [Pseudomonas sp. NBRC 111122]